MSNRSHRGSRLPDIKVADTDRGALYLRTAASRTASGRYYLLRDDGVREVVNQNWAVGQHKIAKGLDPMRAWPRPGRPRTMTDGRDVRVRLGAEHMAEAERLGDGNLSAGVRAALAGAARTRGR